MPGASLDELGLRRGERVRWRSRAKRRWVEGSVSGRERDGSIGVHDADGRARAIAVERLEVRAVGPRGAARWEPLPDRIRRTEQLPLFDT